VKFRHRSFAVATLALALVPLLAGAQPPSQRVAPPALDRAALDRASPDIPRSVLQRKLALTPSMLAATAVSDADVGDVDSFGRALRWLGVADMSVELRDSCPGANPDSGCQVLAPGGAVTSFAFDDLGYISLPGKATHSLLCYWFSPFLSVSYDNPTAAPVVARLSYTPTLTVENPLLDDPALVDPTTGLPFGGRLLTGMTSSEWFEVPLPAGTTINERTRDSTVCIAGFLSRETLMLTYGLTNAQAKAFFKKPTTVRLNISGSAQYVSDAWLYFGFRIIGD
jgi:hypothetical protein